MTACEAPVVALTAAATARSAQGLLARTQPGGRSRWDRTNHAGRTVTLLEGPAWALGATTALTALGMTRPAARRPALAGVLAVTGAALVGALDDHRGATDVKGLRGHLAALREGRVTTGVLKIVGLVGTGLATTAVLDRGTAAHHEAVARPASVDVTTLARLALGTGVVAGSANLANLFDLRPGRALKVVTLAAPLAGAQVCSGAPHLAAVAAGTSLALLPEDLAGTSMLGDTGANPAGALLGAAVVAGGSIIACAAALTVVTGMILASERVSFTQVIARTPVLDALDRWGRAT